MFYSNGWKICFPELEFYCFLDFTVGDVPTMAEMEDVGTHVIEDGDSIEEEVC
jgi:hypothetical protein